MRRREPPPLAMWMLRHLTAGDRDEALAGDLLEEFHAGRSKTWFWRQVTTAVLLQSIFSLFRRRVVLVFAIAWSLLSPPWQVVFIQLENRADFAGFIWRLPWPWSTLCDFGWTALKHLMIVWIGALVYITVAAILRKKVDLLPTARGMGASIVVYCAASACWIAAITIVQPSPMGIAMDWRTFTQWNAIAKMGFTGIAPIVPDVLAMVCALWGTEVRARRPLSMAT